MKQTWAIEASGLIKTYGDQRAVDGVNLRVAAGTIFALLGPNGAGKTTTVRMLATLLRPDGGSARVAGFDLVRQQREVRRRISLTGQYAALDEFQTGEENLRMLARLAGFSASQAKLCASELLERFDLVAAAKRPASTYSGGMRRRLDLAASLIGEPSIIFLDEPTTGLDPRSRQTMWRIITGLVDSGVTIFLTTQYLEEADQLADRIAVIDHGRIVAEGTASELKQRVAEQRLELTLANRRVYDEISQRIGSRVILSDADRCLLGVETDGSAAHIRGLLDEIDPDGRAILRFDVHRATLDDVFLALTGHATGSQTELETANV